MGWFSRANVCETPPAAPRPKPATIPHVTECPYCQSKGFKFRKKHHIYVTDCIECGGKREHNWFFEDSPLLHHSYSFCPDCLRSDHSRCYTTTTCYVGPRELAASWFDEQLRAGAFPSLQQTAPNWSGDKTKARAVTA